MVPSLGVHADKVRDYYEANTRGFLRFGHSGEVGAIHRAVWSPGVQTRAEALRTCERRVVAACGGDATRVLDLGCGVGASLAFVAEETDAEGVGVSVSPLQVRLGNARFEAAGAGTRLRCVEADFTALPEGLGVFDLAYAIEAFVHASSAEAFFREAARVLSSGATLVLIDDFCAERVHHGETSRREARWLREFQQGWHVGSLLSPSQVEARARDAGFDAVSREDLTPFLELRRPRDLAITGLVRLGRRLPLSHPWWLNLLGGNALQMALVRRLLTYQVLTFRRR